MLSVEVIETSELGDRSYVAHDGSVAVVVDPQRDIDRVEALLAQRGLSCAVVVETHVHNDYVTGGYELARRTGATYVVSRDDDVAFDRYAIDDGESLEAGGMRVRAVATPGHTDHHLSYVVEDRGTKGVADAPAAVFTGGSLLYGSVGRTDLVDPDRTDELARAQFHSARRLANLLDAEARVFPTHGFGSFCSSGSASGGESGTIGEERTRNDALVEDDEDAFVERLLSGLAAYPRYYAHMAPRNRQGPSAADLSAPKPVDGDELRKRVAAGEWVVDLRDKVAYAGQHLVGTIGIPLGQQFSTYLGWLIPWGTPLTLIGETPEQVADAQRQLVRIGIDRPAGAAVGDVIELAGDDELRGYARTTVDDVESRIRKGDTDGFTILDVRREDERAAGYVTGSVHVPLHSLLERLDELPDGPLWVHCASGYRASIAASLLDRAGRDAVLVDGDYPAAIATGVATD